MGESDHIVADAAEKIFSDLADPQSVNSAKDDSWKARLWRALEDNGLTLAWVSENQPCGPLPLPSTGTDVVR